MKRKNIFTLLICVLIMSSLPVIAQIAPGLKWQKTFGGSKDDKFYFSDGTGGLYSKLSLNDHDGYIIAGRTLSVDGDIIGSHGSDEIWVAKLDTARNIKWSISLGGSSDDRLTSVKSDIDGGYLIIGDSWSSDGDLDSNKKTALTRAWIVKLSHDGKLLWQKALGEGAYNFFGDIQTVGTEGYIISGWKVTRGAQYGNLWLVKFDRNANLVWEKTYGGSGDDADGMNIQITRDSGFILAGLTNSVNGDVIGSHGTGTYDIWVVKFNSEGLIEWQKCLGGSGDEFVSNIKVTDDGGYIVVGNTNSKNGDPTGLKGGTDGWIVKLNSTGQIQWQKTVGGSGSESLADILIMPDKSYVVIGSTSSTDGDVKFNHGGIDYWLLNVDTSGNIIWENTYGGSGKDVASEIDVIGNEFVILGESNSNDQQVTGNHGGYDWWLLRVGATNTISGYTFYDANSNGIKDADESYIDQVKVLSDKQGSTTSSVSLNGIYRNDVDTGIFITKAIAPLNYYTVAPANITSSFTDVLQNAVANFALQPIPGKRDVTINMISGNSLIRPGTNISYNIIYKNVGTEIIAAGSVIFVKDHRTNFVSSNPAQTSIVNDTIYWKYSSLKPLESRSINMLLQVSAPPVVNSLDTVTSIASIEQDGIDLTPSDNTTILKQVVRGSYDPNDKSEGHSGNISRTQVVNGEYLTYTIRFQNTGNDTAFTISIRDTLDAKLDLNTLQMISSSHPYQLSLKDNNKLTWDFNGIQLPDSNVNENASHGYIAYRIKPKSNLIPGDIVINSAAIFFDYNLPVLTNTVQTKVNNLTVLPTKLTSFTAVLGNNEIVRLNWKASSEINLDHYEIEKSYDGYNFNNIVRVPGNKSSVIATYSINDSSILKANNYYRLRIIDVDGFTTYSSIVLVKTEENPGIDLTVYPNPAINNVNIKIKGEIKGYVTISLIDMSGKTVLTNNFGYISTNDFNSTLALTKLDKGTYNIKVKANGIIFNQKLIIQ